MARWDDAVVAEAKILDYLLAPDHPTGGDKASFFLRLGYRRGSWARFRDDLVASAQGGEVVVDESTEFGIKTVVDGSITAPGGRKVRLRTIWIRDDPGDPPRLVTAYPRK